MRMRPWSGSPTTGRANRLGRVPAPVDRLLANLGRAAPRCAIDSRLHRILHRCDEFVYVKGFPNQAYALRENSTFHVRLIGVGGDEDDRRILPRLVTAQKLQQFQTADSWQIDIQHEHLDTNVVENGSCGGGVVHHGCAPTRHVVEQLTQEFSTALSSSTTRIVSVEPTSCSIARFNATSVPPRRAERAWRPCSEPTAREMPIRDLFCGVSRRGHQLFEGCGGYEISHWRGSRDPWNVGIPRWQSAEPGEQSTRTHAAGIQHDCRANHSCRQQRSDSPDAFNRLGQGAASDAPEIVRPTAAEVVGRPSEPLPRYDPESVQPENT